MIKPEMSQEEIQALKPWKCEPTVDYHNFSHRGSSEEHCRKLDIGPLYLNAATCLRCGYFIRSRNRHDFVTCRCGAISVDGGSWYARRNGDARYTLNHIEHFNHVEAKNESELSD